MEHFEELIQSKIFCSASEFECQAMMYCFKTRFKTFDKNQKIISQGEPMEDVILILKGSATVENIDRLGNISLVTRLKKTDTYGIESAYAGDENYLDSVIANEKTLVLFMNKHRLITPCENRCMRHELVLKHLTQIVAESNKRLLNKLTHISKRTIRDKLLSYFHTLAKDSDYFELPFNKTELSNYLAVDRSAMSTELKKMKDEGIIDFDGREFRLLKK